MINKLLVFDLVGKFACWKKFYTNSSSFTSFIPSRTNLIGIIASILELPRDSYYTELNSENCKLSIAIKSELKKQFHCMNYFKKPNIRDYTQVRLEVLSPIDIKSGKIRYRVYIWIKDNVKFTFQQLIDKIKNNSLGFGVYLGQRQFKGEIEFVDVVNNITENDLKGSSNEISTITNVKNLISKEDLIFDNNTEIYFEKFPFDFEFAGGKGEENRLNRELKSVGKVVYNKIPNSTLKVQSAFKKVLEIKVNNTTERIAFYENEF